MTGGAETKQIPMNYLVATLPNQQQAEAAYAVLEKEGLPMDAVSILGQGYQSIHQFDFLDPKRAARRQAQRMAYWLVPFGFLGGYAFNLSTQFNLLPAAGPLGNHLIGALCGAVGGAMGSFFVGGGTRLLFDSGDTLPFRNRIKAGKYLLVVQGTPNLTSRATRLLKPLTSETMQGYIESTG